MSLMSLTAVALGKKIQAGEVTVEEAVLDALEQIEKKEDTIHSYVTVLEKEAILEKAKEIVQPDLTIAIMSGNYVQRGEVAIIDKFKRSELAIKYGVDLVIELPFVYVSQSADYFCKGAIALSYRCYRSCFWQ